MVRHYLGRYSPTGTEPVMGVGDDDTMVNRPCSFTMGSKIERVVCEQDYIYKMHDVQYDINTP